MMEESKTSSVVANRARGQTGKPRAPTRKGLSRLYIRSSWVTAFGIFAGLFLVALESYRIGLWLMLAGFAHGLIALLIGIPLLIYHWHDDFDFRERLFTCFCFSGGLFVGVVLWIAIWIAGAIQQGMH